MGKISEPEQGRHTKKIKALPEHELPQVAGNRATGSRGHGTLERILRRAQVEETTGLPPSTIYDKISKGTFPRPIKLGKRSVGWIEAEIVAWQKARIAERDDLGGQAKDEIAGVPLKRPTTDRAGNDCVRPYSECRSKL
jgi:prophage regulatory protein